MKQQDTPRSEAHRKAWNNQERLRTWWPELRGRVQERWSRLSDEWLDEVDGRRDRLSERLRDAYGVSEEEANRQVDDFIDTHWNALSANSMANGRSTGGRASTTDVHEPGPTHVGRERAPDVTTGTVNPGGRKI